MIQSQFLDDAANNGGGGIANIGGSLDVRQSTFSGDAGGSGPAIYNVADNSGHGGGLVVLDSTFANNITSGHGGAVDLEAGSQATVVDCTFTGNFAGGGGGAIALVGQTADLTQPTSLTLAGSTLFGNLTTTIFAGGGLSVQDAATALVRDTIIAGNQTQIGVPSDVVGALDPASAFDLIGVSTELTGISGGANGNLVGTPGAAHRPEARGAHEQRRPDADTRSASR